MMIEVVKTIHDLEHDLVIAQEKGDTEKAKQIEFALEQLKKVQQFGEKQNKKETRYG